MATISIEVTDIELKCMEYCAASPQDWADNAVTNRARIAGDEIVSLVVAHCNENSIALAVGRDAQIQQAGAPCSYKPCLLASDGMSSG